MNVLKNNSVNSGLSFGLTSGVITTLGLMIGLYASTDSRLAVIGGVLTIAVTDALSDALGMHVSQESQRNITEKNVWIATASTFLAKFNVACTFVIPVLLLELPTAVLISIIWGVFLLSAFSVRIAKGRNIKAASVVTEHLTISALVIGVSFFVGKVIALIFG